MLNYFLITDISLAINIFLPDESKIHLCLTCKFLLKLLNYFRYDTTIRLSKILSLPYRDRFFSILIEKDFDKDQLPSNLKTIVFEIVCICKDIKVPNFITKSLSEFDTPIGSNIRSQLTSPVQSIRLCDYFGQSLKILPLPISEIFLHKKYNYYFEVPLTVTYLDLGDWFNIPITLPNSIIGLKFSTRYNQKVKIPQSVSNLVFGHDFSQNVQIPLSVINLSLGLKFNRFVSIPNSVKKLTLECPSHNILVPDSVTHLVINYPNYALSKVCKSISRCDFKYKNTKLCTIPESVTHLTFGNGFSQHIVIPKTVTNLVIGSSFSKTVSIPETVTSFIQK